MTTTAWLKMVVVPLAGAALGLMWAGQLPRGTGLGDEEIARIESEVRAFASHYIETLHGDDEDAIRQLFVADGRFTWFTDGAQSYASGDDVVASLKRYAGMEFDTTLSDVVVTPLSRTLATLSSRFQTTMAIPNADDYTFGGVITWVLERSADLNSTNEQVAVEESGAVWRVVSGHTSTPGGPPSGSRAR
jgi:hypothetical protein